MKLTSITKPSLVWMRSLTFPLICASLVVLMFYEMSSTIHVLAGEEGEPAVKLEIPKAENEPVRSALPPDQSLQRQNWIKAAVLVKDGKTSLLEQLLQSDPGLATRAVDSTVSTTLLHHACTYDQTASIKLLLEHGADVEAKAGWIPETPLHVAARTDSINAVQLLLDEGADINIKGAGPKPNSQPKLPAILITPVPYASPLDVAAAAGSERVVELLLKRGAEVDINPDRQSYSSLHRALEGRYNVMGYGNLRRQFDPTLQAAPGNRKVIEMLLEHDCDLGDTDFLGNTPFHIAVRRGASESVEYLLTSHAADIDVNEPGQFGYTPLQLAVAEFRTDAETDVEKVIELLLKAGADREQLGGPSIPPTSAFDVAVQQKWGEPILKLLRP